MLELDNSRNGLSASCLFGDSNGLADLHESFFFTRRWHAFRNPYALVFEFIP